MIADETAMAKTKKMISQLKGSWARTYKAIKTGARKRPVNGLDGLGELGSLSVAAAITTGGGLVATILSWITKNKDTISTATSFIKNKRSSTEDEESAEEPQATTTSPASKTMQTTSPTATTKTDPTKYMMYGGAALAAAGIAYGIYAITKNKEESVKGISLK